MRKPILIALFAFFGLQSNAQIKDTVGMNIPIKDGSIVYQGVIDVSGKTKQELFKNAQQWFVDYFKSSKDVIQNQDKEDGLIVGKGLIDFTSKVGFGMSATSHDKLTVKIECKDNKYRYTIYDLVYYPPAYNEAYATPFDKFYGKLIGTEKLSVTKGAAKATLEANDKAIKSTISSLMAAMVKKSDEF